MKSFYLFQIFQSKQLGTTSSIGNWKAAWSRVADFYRQITHTCKVYNIIASWMRVIMYQTGKSYNLFIYIIKWDSSNEGILSSQRLASWNVLKPLGCLYEWLIKEELNALIRNNTADIQKRMFWALWRKGKIVAISSKISGATS